MTMTIEEAKQILFENRRSTCSCKYNSLGEMFSEALKLKEEQEKKQTQENPIDGEPI